MPKTSLPIAVAAAICVAGPVAAQSSARMPCDQFSVDVFPKTAHFANYSGFDIPSNGVFVSCGKTFQVTESLDVVAGVSAMSFINSFDAQSFTLGGSLEVQYRPEWAGNFGVFGGLDLGVIYGYEGFFHPNTLYAGFTAGGNAKAGVLYDISDTNITVYGGTRVLPPVFGVSGIISPMVGMTYHF